MDRKTLTDYYENGRIRLQSIWEREMAIIRGWREDGKRDFEVIIHGGLQVSKKVWDEQGHLLSFSA
jgi:antitoxin component YwqK of YwqJK toxin-antitoxin module